MSKQKLIFLNSFIGILGVIMLLLTFQFGFFTEDKIQAASKGKNYLQEKLVLNATSWVKEQNCKKYEFDLFSGASSKNYNIPYFTFTVLDPVLLWGISDESSFDLNNNTFIYHKKSASSASPKNGNIESKFTLSKALNQALKNGTLIVSASAIYGSAQNSNLDLLDMVTMSFMEQSDSAPSKKQMGESILSTSNFSEVFKLKFEVSHNSNGISRTIMKVKDPKIILTTNDLTAPQISDLVVENADIFTKTKNVTFNVSDSQSGIDKIEINGQEVIPNITFANNSTKQNANVSFVVDTNEKVYNIKVYDNVGNVSETTYTSSMIDNLAPNMTWGFTENATFENLRVRFPVTLDKSIAQAEETFYYTYDGTDPKVSNTRVALADGINTFVATEEKQYTIKVYACDTAGNESTFQINLNVLQKYYSYDIKITFKGNTQSVENVSSSPKVLSDTDIKCIVKNEISKQNVTYVFYKSFVNEVETPILDNKFALKENTSVNLVYREKVILEFTKNDYTGTGKPIDIEYTSNCPKDLVNFEILKDNQSATFASLGSYKVNFNIDNENFIGSASATLNIYNPIKITVDKNLYEFKENTFTLDYTISPEVEFLVTFTDKSGNVISESTAKRKGLDAGEYVYNITLKNNFNYVSGSSFSVKTLTNNFTITNKTVEIPAFNEEIVYNGLPFVYQNNLIYKVSVDYQQNGVSVEPKNVGVYDVLIAINQKNYTGSVKGKLTINKQNLNININNKTSVYGEKLQDFTFSASGFVNKENYDFVLVSEPIKDVKDGGYDICLKQIDYNKIDLLKNYELIVQNGKYFVIPRDCLVTIDAGQNKIYGQPDPEKFLYTTTNVLNGEELGVNLVRESGENAGNYQIKLNDWTNKNYNVEFVGANFKINPSRLIANVNEVSKVYGENDPINDITILYGDIEKEELNTLKTQILFERNLGEEVGKYEILAKLANPGNFEIIFISGFLTITPLDIVVTAKAVTKQYGQPDPVFDFLVNGKENTIEFSGSLLREKGEEVSEYKINLGTLYNKNYNITFEPALLKITKADLTITANDILKVYGENDPVLTYTANKNFDPNCINISLSREQNENVGIYEIIGEYSSDFYNINFVKGKFEITPRTAYITLANQSKIYGENDGLFDFDFVNILSKDRDVLANNVVIEREAGEDVGQYKITASCQDANYNFTATIGTFNIYKTNVKLSIENSIFTYDGKEKLPKATLSIDGDISYKITLNGESVEAAINAGKYKVEAYFAGDKNHLDAVAEAYFTINKADIEVTIFKNIFVVKEDKLNNTFTRQDPELSCALKDNEYDIIFDDLDAGSVGKHDYKIVFKNPNYNTIFGTVQIVEVPSNSTNGGSVEFVEGDVEDNNIDLSISKTDDKDKAHNATDMVVDSTYEIKYNQNQHAQVQVKLDYNAKDYNNVFVYVYNDKGEAKLLPYQVVDGKIVFSVDADNMKFAIVRQAAGISIVTIGLLVLLCGLITVSVVRGRKKKKMKAFLRIS